MNPIPASIKIGTVGELLVQLRLLQYGVQAAPPRKDTGNDLIAVRGNTFRAVQVKTTVTGDSFPEPKDRLFHILAFVRLAYYEDRLLLDESDVYLYDINNVAQADGRNVDPDHKISQQLVDQLFPLHSSERMSSTQDEDHANQSLLDTSLHAAPE